MYNALYRMPWAHAPYHTVISIAVGSLSHRWFGAVGGLSDGVSSARAEEAAGARAEREKLHAVVMDPRHDRWVDHRMRNVHFHLTKHDGQSQS